MARPLTDRAPARTCRCTTTSLPSPAGEIVVLRIEGELDLATLAQVREALLSLLAQRPSDLVVDLSGLGFCSTRGLTVLMDAAAEAAAGAMGFAICSVPRPVSRLWSVLHSADDLPLTQLSVGDGVLAAMRRQNVRRARVRRAEAGGPAEDDDDEQLVRRSRGGDTEAYRTLARRHRSRMYRSALQSLTGSTDPADPTGDLATRLRAALDDRA